MNFDDRIEELFIDMTEPPPEKGSVAGAVKSGKQLFITGVLPYASGRIQSPGRAGVEVRLDVAKLAARTAAVMALSYARQELGGSLNKIKRVVKMDASVACGADFSDHAKVADGASDFLGEIFGKYGKHARTVVGASSLPQNACVELSIVFELK
jgi:enamine deaminase RidA (YjgF/YER057c/UK114 family)